MEISIWLVTIMVTFKIQSIQFIEEKYSICQQLDARFDAPLWFKFEYNIVLHATL